MKILLFKIGAIGNVIMTTPLLRQLRKRFPDARIDYLVGNAAAPVLEGNKDIDGIIRFDEAVIFKRKIFKIRKMAKDMQKRQYDMIFVLDRHWLLNLLSRMFRIKARVGFDRMGKEGKFLTHKVYFDGTRHEIYYYLDLLSKVSKADYRDLRPQIAFGKIPKSIGRLKDFICIAPGGASNPGQKAYSKLWTGYKELVQELSKKHKIVLVGDKKDLRITRNITGKDIIDLAGKTTIQETAAVMKKARLVICNDTGAMHIASCVNSDVLSIFGPTDPRRFAPFKGKYLCKSGNGCPCNDIYGKFNCVGNECISRITAKEVMKAAREMLRGK